jgi:hypothetical protein
MTLSPPGVALEGLSPRRATSATRTPSPHTFPSICIMEGPSLEPAKWDRDELSEAPMAYAPTALDGGCACAGSGASSSPLNLRGGFGTGQANR